MKGERERNIRRSRRAENWSIFVKSAYLTAVALAAAILFYLPFSEERQPAADPVRAEKPESFRTAVFLEDGFRSQCGVLCLIGFDGEQNRACAAALPPQTDLSGGSLALRFSQEGPAGVLSRLSDRGICVNRYICLSAENCEQITRLFGDLHYRLPAPVSYYDPGTGDSFLAAEGLNTASGTEFCKLISLACRADAGAGAGLAADLLTRYFHAFSDGGTAGPEQLASVLEHAFRTDLAPEDGDRLRRSLKALKSASFEILPASGGRSELELLPSELHDLGFLPDSDFSDRLKAAFPAG